MNYYQFLFTCVCSFASLSLMAQPQNFEFGMGLPEEPDVNFEKLPVKARLTNVTYRSVSTKASLEKYAPTPGSQGKYGTCTAWAAGYCARTILEAQRYKWSSQAMIDANAFSPGFIYKVTMPNSTNCWGAYISTCMKRLQDTGIPKLADFDEACPSSIPKATFSKAAPFKIKGFATLWNLNISATLKEKVQLMKKSLDEGNPVIIAMVVPNSFCYNTTAVWNPKSTDTPTGNQGHAHGKHAMCIIAYDDEKYDGAFLIQNSWSKQWGDNGRMWVRYKDAADYIYQAVEMFRLPAIKQSNNVVAVDTKLAGSLKLVEETGQEMKARLQQNGSYKLEKAYRSGTRFRIYLNNKKAAYVYAIGSDLSHKVFQVFPHQKGVSPYLNYQYSSIPIPSESKHIRMDGTVGTDYLCVIYSKNPLDINKIRRYITQESSYYSFQQKVKKALGTSLIATEKCNFANSEMGFETKDVSKTAAAIFVEIEHVE